MEPIISGDTNALVGHQESYDGDQQQYSCKENEDPDWLHTQIYISTGDLQMSGYPFRLILITCPGDILEELEILFNLAISVSDVPGYFLAISHKVSPCLTV